jgi:deoxyribose-phosphate aldolase
MSVLQTPAAESSLGEWQAVARVMDHTLLRPEATREEVMRVCREAVFYGCAALFVPPCYTALAAVALHGTPVRTGAPVSFPHGNTLTAVKRAEAAALLKAGADELDMVLNVSALKSGDHRYVENDIRAVVEPAHDAGALVKVILETVLLADDEKRTACELSLAAGADFVKTSTGLGGGGATVDDVALMRQAVGNRAGVKASGGIRTAADTLAMLRAGADRIGTSSTVVILAELGAPPPAARS